MLFEPTDLAYFILAFSTLMIVPGFALAAAALPKALPVERLAFAIPLAYGLVSLSGLICELLHQHFDINTYAVVAVLVTLLSLYVHLRWRKREKRSVQAFERWQLVPIGVGAIYLIALLTAYIHQVVPSGSDTSQHVSWVNLIVEARVFPLRLNGPVIDSPNGAFYPPAFHVVSALIHELVPVPTYRVAFYSVVSSIVLMPFALYSYVKMLTSSARLGALAGLASLAFFGLSMSALPGGLLPLITSLLIAPMLALALYSAVMKGERGAAALSVLLGVGLFYTHPTEFITTGLLDLALWLSAVPFRLPSRRGLMCLALFAVALGLTAWPAMVGVIRTITVGAQGEIHARGLYNTGTVNSDVAGIALGYVRVALTRNLGYVLLAAVLVGIARCLMERRWLGLVVAQAFVLFVVVDSNTYNLLGRFYTIAFPWALWYRLVDTSYWTLLPLAAVGIDALIVWLVALYHARGRLYLAVAVSPLIVFGLGLPLDASTLALSASNLMTQDVAPADLGSIAWLAHHASMSIVVNDENSTYNEPIDAGLWMPQLGGPQPAFWISNSGPGSLTDRIYVLKTIAQEPLPHRTLDFFRRYHVQYVFYGAGVRSIRHLNLQQLLHDPLLQVAYVSEAICRIQARWNTPICNTASYVFRLPVNTA